MPPPSDRAARLRLDLTDQRFGMLVAKARLPKRPGTQGEIWRCLCTCGGSTEARVKDLRSGNTRSCGCLTHRARRAPDQPHRAGDEALYPALQAEVWAALAAGHAVCHAALRGKFDNRTSRSSLYRLIRRAAAAWEQRPHPQ